MLNTILSACTNEQDWRHEVREREREDELCMMAGGDGRKRQTRIATAGSATQILVGLETDDLQPVVVDAEVTQNAEANDLQRSTKWKRWGYGTGKEQNGAIEKKVRWDGETVKSD
jgi:hypothetical protein